MKGSIINLNHEISPRISWFEKPNYEKYKGYSYKYEIHEEDDNVKIFHDIVYGGGRFEDGGFEVAVDFTPYSYLSGEQFKRCVDEIEKQKFCEEMFDWMKEQIYQKRVKPD